MICAPCKRREHAGCINVVKLGIALSTWCDCQHRQLDQAKVAEVETTNRERIAAVVARHRPRPTVRSI